MKLGLAAAFGNSERRDIGFLKAAAQAIEAVGFDSLWLPEHVVFFSAADYESKYPYSEDGSPPWGEDMGVFDPLFGIAVAAQVTTRLRFATSVLILPQRPPLLTAKEVMTLDHITEGRFEFGVGGGWSKEEYEALGVPFEKRGKRFDEYIKAIKAAWASPNRSSFEGEFVRYQNAVMLPRPYTPGGPPFLIGGDSEAAMRRAATLGDGWYGWWAKYELAPHLELLRAELRKVGRENDPNFRLKLGIPYSGTPDDLHLKIEEAKREGVIEFVMALPFSSKKLEKDLEMWAAAAGVSSRKAA
jgi:probable F420-dependent oxidoreductase